MNPWDGCIIDGIATLACAEGIVKLILNIAIRLAGIATFVMLLVGGFQYLTAGNDPKKTQAASSTLGYAIFGLVAVLVAWFILLFVEKFTGVPVTQFSLPFKLPIISK